MIISSWSDYTKEAKDLGIPVNEQTAFVGISKPVVNLPKFKRTGEWWIIEPVPPVFIGWSNKGGLFWGFVVWIGRIVKSETIVHLGQKEVWDNSANYPFEKITIDTHQYPKNDQPHMGFNEEENVVAVYSPVE